MLAAVRIKNLMMIQPPLKGEHGLYLTLELGYPLLCKSLCRAFNRSACVTGDPGKRIDRNVTVFKFLLWRMDGIWLIEEYIVEKSEKWHRDVGVRWLVDYLRSWGKWEWQELTDDEVRRISLSYSRWFWMSGDCVSYLIIKRY